MGKLHILTSQVHRPKEYCSEDCWWLRSH